MARIPNEAIKFDPRITISTFQDGQMRIEIEDGLSRTRVCEVDIYPATLALAIAGRADKDCIGGKLYPGPVGYIHETKTENIPLESETHFFGPDGDAKTAAAVDALLAPYEVEGWHGYRNDVNNGHHRDTKSKTVNVSFHRYVHPETGDIFGYEAPAITPVQKVEPTA